jgi:hypothetical protein
MYIGGEKLVATPPFKEKPRSRLEGELPPLIGFSIGDDVNEETW